MSATNNSQSGVDPNVTLGSKMNTYSGIPNDTRQSGLSA